MRSWVGCVAPAHAGTLTAHPTETGAPITLHLRGPGADTPTSGIPTVRPRLQPARGARVLEVPLTAPSQEPPPTHSAQSRVPKASPVPGGGPRAEEGPQEGPGTEAPSCSHTSWQEHEPEQPKAIQSPELLMATDSILWSETLSREQDS